MRQGKHKWPRPQRCMPKCVVLGIRRLSSNTENAQRRYPRAACGTSPRFSGGSRSNTGDGIKMAARYRLPADRQLVGGAVRPSAWTCNAAGNSARSHRRARPISRATSYPWASCSMPIGERFPSTRAPTSRNLHLREIRPRQSLMQPGQFACRCRQQNHSMLADEYRINRVTKVRRPYAGRTVQETDDVPTPKAAGDDSEPYNKAVKLPMSFGSQRPRTAAAPRSLPESEIDWGQPPSIKDRSRPMPLTCGLTLHLRRG